MCEHPCRPHVFQHTTPVNEVKKNFTTLLELAQGQSTAEHLQIPNWKCCGLPLPVGSECALLTTAGS